jgi:hypothetical protein
MPNGKPLVRQAKDRLNEITRLGRRSAGIMPPSVYLIAWVGQAAGQCRRLPGDLVRLVLRNALVGSHKHKPEGRLPPPPPPRHAKARVSPSQNRAAWCREPRARRGEEKSSRFCLTLRRTNGRVDYFRLREQSYRRTIFDNKKLLAPSQKPTLNHKGHKGTRRQDLPLINR